MRKRPIGVWLASLYALYKTLIYLSGTVLLFGVVHFWPEALPEAGQILMESMTPFVALLAWANLFAMLAAGIALFRLKRLATPLFLATAGLTLASSLHGYFTQPELVELAAEASPLPFYLGTLIGTAIPLGIAFYCFRLTKKGVLGTDA